MYHINRLYAEGSINSRNYTFHNGLFFLKLHTFQNSLKMKGFFISILKTTAGKHAPSLNGDYNYGLLDTL